LQGSGITSADKVVLANWKRLNDATWDYEVRSSRNFNALPYSINDSGIAIYFEPNTLSPGSKREITMALGAYNERGFSASSGATSEIADVFNQTMNSRTGDSQDTNLSVQTDLLTINDLLKKINKKFDTGETLTESELDLMTQVINELKKRMNKYSSE